MSSALFAAVLILALGLHLFHHARVTRGKAQSGRTADRRAVTSVVPDAVDASNGTAGVVTWTGTWKGRRVQIRTIVDTLATRKLPAFWLSVTIAEPVAIAGVLDIMMRPGSATTFSNFDHFPHSIRTPGSFPDEAVVRSNRDVDFPLDIVADHVGVLANGRAKELLITPNGVRIVWLMAEADRARYGVFRQAEFSGAGVNPAVIEDLLGRAAALRDALNATSLRAAA